MRDFVLIKEPYWISPDGFVKTTGFTVKCKGNSVRQTGTHILKPAVKNGYKAVSLNLDGSFRGYTIHRLVAATFIPNPDNKPQVNHKNGIKTDNRLENLEWCTQSENTTHAYRTGLLKPAGNRRGFCGKLSVSSKPVIQLTKSGEFVKEWESMSLASKDGFCPAHISSACRGKLTQHGGFKWKYKVLADIHGVSLEEKNEAVGMLVKG